MLGRLAAWWNRVKGWVGLVVGLLFSLVLTVGAKRDPGTDRPRRGSLGGSGGGTPQTTGRPDDGRRRPRRGGF